MSAVMRVSNLASQMKMATDLVSVNSKVCCKTVTYDAPNSKYSYHVFYDICQPVRCCLCLASSEQRH